MLKAEHRPFATAMMAALKASGVLLVVVEFDGGGDSGAITGIEIQGGQPPETAEWLVSESNQVDGKWVTTKHAKALPIKKALEEWCYEALSQSHVDWYNNDGGYGLMEIDLTKDTAELVIHQRYTEVNTSSFSLDDEEVT
jgi:hypothetical protein